MRSLPKLYEPQLSRQSARARVTAGKLHDPTPLQNITWGSIALAFSLVVAGATALPSSPLARDESAFADVAAREDRGPINHRFDQDLERLQSRYAVPKDQLEIDPRLLVGALKIIVRRAQELPESALISSRFGQPLPAGIIAAFRDALERVFRVRLEMPEATSQALADYLEMQVVAAAGVNDAEYKQVVPRVAIPRSALHLLVREMLDAQTVKVSIKDRCDIPFVAGYSNDARVVYIDRSVPRDKSFKGVRVPVAKLLNLHERVEKAVLDEFDSSYPHAHQIALRVEKLAAEAIGAPWVPYNAYWSVVADAMESKPIKQVPRDLDMTPYLTFADPDSRRTVERMRRAFVNPDVCGKPY